MRRDSGPVPFTVREHADTGRGEPGPLLLWEFRDPVLAISSGMLGGGLQRISWVLNAHVRSDYGRTDPDRHLAQMASQLGLDPHAGAGLMTAAQLERVATAQHPSVAGAADGVVRCDATVGISYPTWAVDIGADCVEPWRPGTINLVCQVPVPLTDAALVGAVLTVTEAKTQALLEAGVPGTGTASDAVVICCPSVRDADIAPFAGPRSPWGSVLARAVYEAVRSGLGPRA